MSFWSNKAVLVTGGSGFLGSAIVKKLNELDAKVVAPTHEQYDLVHESQVKKMYADNPELDTVIHLAAKVGGIGANREHPGSFFYDNAMMGVQLLHHAY